MSSEINFDRDKAARFNAAYIAARNAGTDQFSFEGHYVLVSYARYVVEYLKTKGLLEDGR